MSLLTEKQIVELVEMASVPIYLYDKICEWNEKQPSTLFEPDWEKTSSNATKVYLDAVWFNSDMKEIDRTTICGWDRPVTPHPHAALIAKFAEVAARRVDPWREFEYKNSVSGNWEKTISTISFFHDAEYRYIGDNK